MRDLIVSDNCDTGMLIPQPTKWISGSENAISLLINEKWDKVTLDEASSTEEIAIFLRDNPEYCPPRINLSSWLNPLLNVKVKMWLPGKVHEAYAY